MMLKDKMKLSCLEYCKTLKQLNPYVAGDIVEDNITLDSYIDIVIYSHDKETISMTIKSEYDNILSQEEIKDEYSMIIFGDVYFSNQTVRITTTGKDPDRRDQSLVVPAREFFGTEFDVLSSAIKKKVDT